LCLHDKSFLIFQLHFLVFHALQNPSAREKIPLAFIENKSDEKSLILFHFCCVCENSLRSSCMQWKVENSLVEGEFLVVEKKIE
jgi:hypothetical protein